MKPILFTLSLLFLMSCMKEINSSGFDELSFYLTTDTIVRNMLDPLSVEPESEPFITYNDIVSYDSSNQVMRLKRSFNSLFSPDNGFDGRGFVAMLDTTIIYCGVIYSPVHSSTNPNIVITCPLTDESCEVNLRITEGYPTEGYYTGIARVNDPRIIRVLKRDHKLD